MFQRHGLTGNTKRLVFDALYERQQGKCAICGFKAELNSCPDNPQWIRNTNIHYLLYIDHCHVTGMIRGLLCNGCNFSLAVVENEAYRWNPIAPCWECEFFYDWEHRDRHLDCWLGRHLDTVLAYMQQERWLPRKDILFHLQDEKEREV